MLIKDHLKDMKRMFYIILVSFIIVVILTTTLSSHLINIITRFYSVTLYNLHPIESIKMQILFGIISAFIVILPIIIYQLYKFITFESNIKVKIMPILATSYILALTGFITGITYFAKIMLNTIQKYTIGEMVWGLENTLKMALGIGLTLAVCLQLIIIIPLLNNLGIINVKNISLKTRCILLIITLILSAVITPPDIITQVMLTIPIIGSIETGILVSKIGGKRKWQSEQWKASLSG